MSAAVNILNAGVNESTVSYNASAIAALDSGERANVFTEVSVTPTIKTTGLSTVANKSFIEIRKTATFSSDIAGGTGIGGLSTIGSIQQAVRYLKGPRTRKRQSHSE